MAADDDLDDALAALARAEGKTVAELKREIVRERLGRTGAASTALTAGTRAAEPEPEGDTESAAEAQERYFREEAELADGVHGLGGMSAGGIFGAGPIATTLYDPSAHARGEARAATMVQAKMLGLIDRLERRLSQLEGGAGHDPRLPGGPARGLPGRRR